MNECSSYLYLPLAHDLVHDLVVVLVELGLVVALLVAEDAQALRSLQLNFKLLLNTHTPKEKKKTSRTTDEIQSVEET